MDFKLLGGILLIVGTSIGAGMLALPVVTAQIGFIGSIIMLLLCWAIMTIGAYVLLEVNLWMKQNSNIITMAKATLGPFGAIIAWITYLLLLYSLLAAYIGGGSALFKNLILGNLHLPEWLAALTFTLIFGGIVTLGIRSVDYVNRGLMLLKFTALFLLIAFLMPLISGTYLLDGKLLHLTSATAITVTITSFGFATIIPSMRVYFHSDVTKLRKAIFFGSLIPLICYILWDLVIMGTVPLGGDQGLKMLLFSKDATTGLVTVLEKAANNHAISLFVKIFTSVCVLTSFLGVALCLSDFLADGFGVIKKGYGLLVIQIITFLPPLLVVIFDPKIFIKGLEYAGVYCIVLLLLLPACMAWFGRKHHGQRHSFTMAGGATLLISLIIIALGLIAWFLYSAQMGG